MHNHTDHSPLTNHLPGGRKRAGNTFLFNTQPVRKWSSLIFYLFATFFFVSCGGPEGFKKPEDALDAGREFVRAVLDGDYTKAELFVLPEAEDRQLFKRFTEHMKKRPQNERLGLKSASIQINKVDEQNDSVTVINYANSFEKHPADVRVVKHNGEWWVDFSYTFSGRALEDSLK